jgi:iron complex outermembrane receptor protein
LLSDVTVTASLLEQQQKESGRSIIILQGDHFRSLPVHSLDDLLRYLPGIEVQQRGPQGSQGDILIRGGTFQQVLVIIDGIRLNDPLTGHFNGYIPIPPGSIERVEILKGPAAALYGSEAVGGVVHILTRTFGERTPTNGGNGLLQAGAFGSRNVSAAARGRDAGGMNRWSIGMASNNAEGPRLRGTSHFFHLHTLEASLQRQLASGWVLRFRTAGDDRRFNAQNYYTTFASDTARESVNSWWNHLQLVRRRQGKRWLADLGYKKLRDRFWFRPKASANDNRTSLFTSQVLYTDETRSNRSYSVGVQASHKQIRSNDRGDHALWHGAAFGILRFRWETVSIQKSIRVDWDQSYGWILVPQLNASWSPSRLTVRATAGRSFRDADFTERYNNYNRSPVSSGRIGNPDLEPESSWNIEGGMDYHVRPGFRTGFTLFRRWHRNLIDWAPTPYDQMPRRVNLVATGSYALAKNVERVRTTGVELDLQYLKLFSGDRSAMLNLGYTWIRSRQNDTVPSFYIASHARHLLNLSAAWQGRIFSCGLNALYKKRAAQDATAIGAFVSPSYWLMGIKVGIRRPGRPGRIFLQADNLFDRSYSDLLGAPMPGRWLSAGIDLAL